MDTLYYKKQGEGNPFFFLHGLFGMSDNWQTFSKDFATDYSNILVDHRNHGRSFHHPDMNYDIFAHDVKSIFKHEKIDKGILLGHSMGGKTVMRFAQLYPHKVKAAVIVDMAPKKYKPEHLTIFEALRSLDVYKIQSRREAQNHLSQYFQDKGVQLFLLKNLDKTKDGYRWKMNLEAIYKNYDQLTQNPLEKKSIDVPFLFVKGSKSNYIKEDDLPTIRDYFPNSQIEIINAGHWVHAEQPKILKQRIIQFLNNVT